ncbi:hypothetical protein KAR91_51615, partial [Candidatus Pacearchaeota archaeon]|nr:hypothetical protein [Candidatus Pacearchaeota archaeon]
TLQICKDRMTFNYWPIKGLTPHLRSIDQFSSDIEQMMIREETSFFPYLHPEMKTVFRSIIEDRNEVMKKEYDYVSWPHYSTDSLKLDLVIYNRSLTSIPDEDLTACGREMRKNEKEHVECIKKVLESRGVTC